MKRTVVFSAILLTLVIASTGFAQRGNAFNVSAGYVNPTDLKGGMFFGFMFGMVVDDAVNVGLGVDVFHKSYSETSEVASEETEGMSKTTYETSVDYTRTMLPINLLVNVKIPTSPYYGYFVRGGLGYDLLFSKEENYELNKEQSQRFGGFGWQVAGGFYYNLGPRSTLTADIGYNSCEVSRKVENSSKGLPVTERVDISGLGIRVGVNMEL